MGVLPVHELEPQRRKHRRQKHTHLPHAKPRGADEHQTLKDSPERKASPTPRNPLRRHGDLFVGHMEKTLKPKKNHKLPSSNNAETGNQLLNSYKRGVVKTVNTEQDKNTATGALNKPTDHGTQFEQMIRPRINSRKVSSLDLKNFLSPTHLDPNNTLNNGSSIITRNAGGLKNRSNLNNKKPGWIQEDAPVMIENSKVNSENKNIDHKNGTPFHIPLTLSDHFTNFNKDFPNSSEASSPSLGKNPLFPVIPGSRNGISENGLAIPAALGPGILIPSGGATGSILPQPGLDHQDKCGAECPEGSVCLHVKHKSAWECICEGDLKPPHPENGCEPVPRGTVDYDGSQGVISADSHQGIVQFNEKNFGTTNQTLSMLRQPTDTPQSSNHLPEVVIPVVGCVVVIFVLGMFACLYRRKLKLLYFKGKRDSILRNNDGAILLENMNTITKNPTYYYQSATGGKRFNTRIIPAECIVLGQVAGEGAFGQVFKGEMTLPDSDVKTKVAVKILKEGASHEAQEDFEREVEIMSAFDHDNILKLLGIVTQGMENNPYMIFEFMEHGDLTELLRRNDPCNRHVSPPRNGAQTAPGQGQQMTLPAGQSSRSAVLLSKADLVDISVQIANGMSYLASQHFVHRDLATRNCLVGAGLVVKISDFGMSRDIYTNDYYRIGGSRMLPVRWMSPEAIKYGRFTCESDIWAYGVVLWEIFSFGKQPYYGHSNEEVIHFLDQGILLQRPEDCPSTIYHVMIGCWKRDPRQRIIFERLVKYLKDYASHLMNNQRQQQQLQLKQQRQQQKQNEQHHRQQQQLQLPRIRRQHQKQQQRQRRVENGDSPSRSSSSGSDITDFSDVPNTPEETNCPGSVPPTTTARTPGGVDSPVEFSTATPQEDYRHEGSHQLNTAESGNREVQESPVSSTNSIKLDANGPPTLFKSPPSPLSHSHHHRSLTLPSNSSKNLRSVFKSNMSSLKAPGSPLLFRAFSSKKARKAASYSTLTASVPRDTAKCVDERNAKTPQGRRRYSSGEASRFGSLKSLLHSKLSGSFAVETASREKQISMDCVETISSNSSKTAGRTGVTGNLLMDRLNSGNKKTLATQNAYDTSLLRSRGSPFKSATALLATSVTVCDATAAAPPKSKTGVSGGVSSPCNRLQAASQAQESRSTGLRLEWNRDKTDNSALRRAKSQTDSLITSKSASCDLG